MSDGPAPQPAGPAGLFDEVLARGPVRDAVADAAWLHACLEVEAALARAEALEGLIPPAAADAIARACSQGRFDVAAIGRAAAASGNPVVPLVAALTDVLPASAARHVHRGATSQDILDTATMLVTRRALDLLIADVDAAADDAARLAGRHRGTPMAGRTLLQHALPTTFGAMAASWVSGLDAAAVRLAEVRNLRLAVQLGGAAGTLASLGQNGPAVLARLGAELDLAVPVMPWHTERTRLADVAGALGTAAAALAKPALDVVLLAQTDVAEVHEGVPGRGGSSTLPQKRNPVAAVSARASAFQAPYLVAALLAAAGAGELQRAAGAWHAEWRPLADLLRSVGSAAAWLHDCLGSLVVDADRMHENLDRTGGLLLAERVALALVGPLGRTEAQRLVEDACRDALASNRPLGAVLTGRADVRAHLDPGEIEALLDASSYLGAAAEFADRAVAAHAERTGGGKPAGVRS